MANTGDASKARRRNRAIVGGALAGLGAAGLALALLRGDRPMTKKPGTRSSERPASLSAVDVSRAPSPPVVHPSPAEQRAEFVKFTWGSSNGALGRTRPDEANPEGPMSVAPLPGGGLVILDQVNGRLVRVDGKGAVVGTSAMKVRSPQDVAVAKDGTVAVLDRLGDKGVEILGADGRSRGVLPLEGKGIPEGGGTTGLFVDDATGNVLVEREHGVLTVLGKTDGTTSDDRTTIPGRPSRDGTAWLSAGITDRESGRVWVSAMERATTTQRWTRELRANRTVRTLLTLDSDRSGVVYLAEEIPEGEQTFVRVVCLAGNDGHLVGSVDMPSSHLPEETFRDFAILDDGTIVHGERTEAGVRYVNYRCQS